MKKYNPEVAHEGSSAWSFSDAFPCMEEDSNGEYVKAEEAERKVKELRVIAERAIFWIFHASMITEHKEDEEFFENKAIELQEKLEAIGE